MKREAKVIFGLLFLSVLVIVFSSPSVSAVECVGGQQATYEGCLGTYSITSTFQGTGSCWYRDEPCYDGEGNEISCKAWGIANGIYCWEYGNREECFWESGQGAGFCEWYLPGGTGQFTNIYECSELPTEEACIYTAGGGCTPDYSCSCEAGTSLQIVDEEFAHCTGTGGTYTYTIPAYCGWKSIGCAGSTPFQCEANNGCFWNGNTDRCAALYPNTCSGLTQSQCGTASTGDPNCNWIPTTTYNLPIYCYSEYPTESECLSHQADGCSAVYDNVYQCVATPFCQDSDGSPTNYNTWGAIHSNNGAILNGYNAYGSHAGDFCFDSAQDPFTPVSEGDGLHEYGCSGTTSVLNAVPCQYGCSQGKCNPTPPTCSDSDGGLVYTTQGTVTASSPGVSGQDYCVVESVAYGGPSLWKDPSLGSQTGSHVVEYGCFPANSGSVGQQVLYQCPAGCLNGKCNPLPPSCQDSDGGVNYFTRGTVTTEQGQYVDFCGQSVPDNYGDVLNEYFCSDSGPFKELVSYTCPNDCFNGACVRLYFSDASGNELTNYSSKHVGDTVYLWAKNFPLSGTVDSFTIKDYDPISDDIIRSGLQFTIFTANGIGTLWTITQSDINICNDGVFGSEGPECEFYFEIVEGGTLYRSSRDSPYLLVPVNWSGGFGSSTDRYWANPNDLSIQWQVKNYAGPFDVGLVMLNYGTSIEPMFTIRSEDSSGGGSYNFGNFGGGITNIDGDTEADDAYYIWRIDQSVIDIVSEFDDDSFQFYFDINSGTSPVFTVTQNIGTCGNGICEPPGENETTCPDDCLAACAEINFCQDYLMDNMCDYDTCGVAASTPPCADPSQSPPCEPSPGYEDRCIWNSLSDPACKKYSPSTTSNGNSIGSCSSQQNSMSNECAGGFLTYSWTSIWKWDEENSHEDLQDCLDYSPDCTEETCILDEETALYHCDPNDIQSSCTDGSAIIPCPAQIQLNFFDWKNLVVAVLLIFVLYVIFRKRKSKGKKSSKK